MGGKRARMIHKLVYNKDSNMLDTIERYRGKTLSSKMNGRHIYKWAKKLWRTYGVVDNWGKQIN